MEIGARYQFGSYLISRQEGETLLLPVSFSSAVVSEDNMGGYIVTAQQGEGMA